MEHLIQFQQDFIEDKLQIHDVYCCPIRDDKTHDVVTDLTEKNLLYSAACLPVMKAIAIDKSLEFKIPRLGDLFIGIKHHAGIQSVTYHLHNYQEELIIEGVIRTGSQNESIWCLTNVPLPFIVIGDYDQVYLQAQVHLKANQQDIIKAYYGYCHQSLQYELTQQAIYHLPLITDGYVKVICGIWTIVK